LGSAMRRDVALVQMLEATGPGLSSEIIAKLCAQGLTPEAARQQVSRAVRSGVLCRNSGLAFPHREAFLYLEEQRGAPVFLQRLWEAMGECKTGAAHCLHAVDARGGLIPEAHFAGVGGLPERLKKHPPPERVLDFLLGYGFLERRDVPGIGGCLQLGREAPLETRATPKRLRARLLAESIALKHFSQSFTHWGLMPFQSYHVRSDTSQPSFGHCQWDLTSPSYAHPFTSRSSLGDLTPGFIVADVSLEGAMTPPQVRSFLRKCEIIRNQKRSRPFLSVLVADHFTSDAFTEVRKGGSLAVSLSNLLGEDLARALKHLLAMLSSTTQLTATDPQVIHDVMSKLSAIEGAGANLRGPLFELIVGHCVQLTEGGTVEVQKLIRAADRMQMTDIDVLCSRRHDVTAYECKGHLGHLPVGRDEVERWLGETVPKIREYLLSQDQYAHARHRFALWTTGRFDDETLAYLERRRSETKKYDIDFKDGQGVLKYVSGARAGKLADVLREHYLSHALTKIDNSARREAAAESASPPDGAADSSSHAPDGGCASFPFPPETALVSVECADDRL
jgi:hypothetical protein